MKAIHNGKSGSASGFVGTIPDNETYQEVKNGNKDWKPHIKSRMTHILIPYELFCRLMELDKAGESNES